MGCPFKVSVEPWSHALTSPLSFLYEQMTYWPRLCSLNAGRPTPRHPATLCLFPTLHLAPALPTITTHSDPDLLALLLLACSDPSALTADTGYPSEAMRTHSRDPALLSLDPFLAIPGHYPPWEGPHLQSWGHCFCRDPFCLLKTWYRVIKGYHWLELSYAFFLRDMKVAGRVQA